MLIRNLGRIELDVGAARRHKPKIMKKHLPHDTLKHTKAFEISYGLALAVFLLTLVAVNYLNSTDKLTDENHIVVQLGLILFLSFTYMLGAPIVASLFHEPSVKQAS
jgi:hypothetical protein